MATIPYTSIDRIISKLIRDLGITDINESNIVEWCAEALEFIGAIGLYEEAVAFIEVKNHQCQLPTGLHSIIQVARDRLYNPSNRKDYCPKNTVDCIKKDDDDLVNYTLIDCQGMPLTDTEIAYYRPYYDLRYEYYGWSNSSYYANHYSPVRLSTNPFMNSIINCDFKDDEIYRPHNYEHSTLDKYGDDEYTIIKGEYLRFSFKEGYIALAYTRQVVDKETGYPMIPDHVVYTTAITKYVSMKMIEREFFNNREGSAQKLAKYEQDWQWYCKGAGNYTMMPKEVDEFQNLLEMRNRYIPSFNSYYGFFGKLGKREPNWNFNRRDYIR